MRTLFPSIGLAIVAVLSPRFGHAEAPRYPPAIPRVLALQVRETAGIARSGEMVRSGVPLPRRLNVRDLRTLAVVNSAGSLVPADFQALARWNAGRDDLTAPIQWVLVTFPATVPARGTATYSLLTSGPASRTAGAAVTVSRVGNLVRVSTGAAIFTLGADPGALFDEIRLSSGSRLVTGSALTARVEGAYSRHPMIRRTVVQQVGPLAAVVAIEGLYDMPSVGGGGLASRRRYVFTAGSPTVIIRHSVAWEGDRCGKGVLSCGGVPNGVRVQQIRDALNFGVGAPVSVTAVGDFEAPALQGTVAAGGTAWVRQRLRARRTEPLSFDVKVADRALTGGQADGGMLAVAGPEGALAIGLNHMHRYEPQALCLLADGRMAVDIADDQVWLGARQGLFATLAVTALPARFTRADLNRLLWAPLNHPLRAWPQADWFAASEAVDEFPVGALPASLAGYDTHLATLLPKTLQRIDEKGLAGLMTFGVYPRYWGVPTGGDEIAMPAWDPTPGESWDDVYWGTTWTDYHNTAATAPIWAMRSGEVEWLDEIAFPAALRTLHTQIMQAAPNDPDFYAGQAPSGYGGYRSDFNGAHAYFENLILYYWLTGDDTVVETLTQGARSMRQFLCSRRPGAPCLPTDPPSVSWAYLTGRDVTQWYTVFRFLGLAGSDASYLEDWRSGLARAVTQNYVEAQQGGARYGFWLRVDAPVKGPGTYATDQLWMTALYDMNNLYRLQRDTDDAPIGEPPVRPSQALAALARTLTRFAPAVGPESDGTVRGRWPNALNFTWSGPRIGGQLESVSADLSGNDLYLYDYGKSCLVAAVVRAAVQTGDPDLMRMGVQLTEFTLNAARADPSPLGKLQGLFLSRLHAAVAQLAAR